MTISKQKAILISVIAFFVGAAVTCGVLAIILAGVGNYTLADKTYFNEAKGFYDKYRDLAIVDGAIDDYYYIDTSDIDKVNPAAKAVVDALDDPYSAYMTKAEYENYIASTEGSYSGCGIVFSKDEDGNYVVVNIYEGSPADKSSDIQPGDFILKVDGKSYDDQDVMAANIRGDKGSKVKIQYEHEGKKNTVELVRDDIVVTSVKSEVRDDGLGYIAISEFLAKTGEEFDKAFKKLQDSGCDKIILDLRNNGGGLVDQAVHIADTFIDSGYITCTVDRNGDKHEYKSDSDKSDVQLVVLVNENSASSSEILAGALQDNGYKLVGQKTFGKGIIQSSMELDDGSAIKLTIAQYLTPDGHKVHKKGLKPDYDVKNGEKGDAQLNQAVKLLK